MAELRISSQTLSSNTALCKLAGALDAHGFDICEEEFQRLVDSGATGILLDCSGLESFTSAGMGLLLNLSQTLASRGGKLVAAAVPHGPLSTVDLLGIRDALALQDTLDAGRKALAAALAAQPTA